VEWLLSQIIEAERKSAVIDESSVKRVAVDTTVMEKTTAYPTDARLYERARGPLIAFAQEAGVDLRQTYAGLAPRQALQVGRMRKASKRLKGYTGRAMRDLRSYRDDLPAGALRERVLDKLVLVSHLLHQQPKSGHNIRKTLPDIKALLALMISAILSELCATEPVQ